MKRVEVIWNDAHSSDDFIALKEAKKAKPIRTSSLGYLLAENDEGITLVMDNYGSEKKGGKQNGFITWDMIAEYYELV